METKVESDRTRGFVCSTSEHYEEIMKKEVAARFVAWQKSEEEILGVAEHVVRDGERVRGFTCATPEQYAEVVDRDIARRIATRLAGFERIVRAILRRGQTISLEAHYELDALLEKKPGETY